MMVHIVVIKFLFVGISMVPLMLGTLTIQTRTRKQLAWAFLALLASLLFAVDPTTVARARVDGVIFGWSCGG
jgi:hypothetical protein